MSATCFSFGRLRDDLFDDLRLNKSTGGSGQWRGGVYGCVVKWLLACKLLGLLSVGGARDMAAGSDFLL